MEEATKEKKLIDWTTREELLLACAVERYGKGDWKTVAMEIQARTSLPVILLSAEACKSKFHDLKRRFMDDGNDDEEQDGVVITWLEELRKLRVLELKEEVHQSDLSIQRLQLKVKRLEDERDTCLKMSGDRDVNLDLTERCPDETESPKASSAAADGLDRNHHHSVNESNSSDYIDDSSATIGQHAVKKRRSRQDAKRVNSSELSNQTAELKIGKTVSKKRALDKDHPNQERKLLSTTVSPATSDVKPDIRSQPLVELLDVIRSHKQIRMLESRAGGQNPAVRQRVDLESIRSRIDNGSYSSDVNKFYRDLLLFVTNVIVSYPKTSSESAASHKIRDLVLNHLKDNKPSAAKPPMPVETAAKHEQESSSASVLVVCRRRSSGTAKPNKSSPVVIIHDKIQKKEISSTFETNEGKGKSATPAPGTKKAKNQQVKIASGVKSLRRGVTSRVENSPEKKKRPGNDDRKKKEVVEFLKRIVSKSPPEKSKGRKIELKKKSGSRGGDKVDGGKKGKNSPERIVGGKRKRGGKEEVPLRITKKSTKK